MKLFHFLQDLRQVLLVLVFLLVFFIVLSPPQDADMWWHLAAGKKMVEQAKILTTDTFSYTHRDEVWTNAFWISDIVLFLAYRIGGYLGLSLLTASVAVFTMSVIFLHARNDPLPISLILLSMRLVDTQPLNSMIRYVLTIFPVFYLFGMFAQQKWVNLLMFVFFLSLNLFLSAQFFLWGWVA